jgi:hypothetical protein
VAGVQHSRPLRAILHTPQRHLVVCGRSGWEGAVEKWAGRGDVRGTLVAQGRVRWKRECITDTATRALLRLPPLDTSRDTSQAAPSPVSPHSH